MALRFQDTLTRRVEPFEPLDPGRVGVYACGPTIYGHAHIGNFRAFVFYDLVHRYLEWKGYGVRFVMNLTDVDDKTIRAAREAGTTIAEYTEPFARSVLAEADALGIARVDLYPRATAYVDRMIELVERLLDRGLAYVTDDGSVFFDISAFPGYGRLSRKDLDQVRTGERVAADEYGKDDVRDFALWKAVKPEDEEVGAAWDAPWGRGRPGWHLECSAMSLAEVGETLDLHLGGEDLIFPHHEDEIAQSEGATGKPFVRVWLHVKHLRVEGEKMSKSAGNFITVRELLDEGVPPAAIRHQLLATQYRRELNFTRAGLEASERAVDRILDFEDRLAEGRPGDDRSAARPGPRPDADPEMGGVPAGDGTRPGGPEAGLAVLARRARDEFEAAMDEDLNVSEGLAALFVFVNEANRLLDDDPDVPATERDDALAVLRSLDRVLGLLETGRRQREVADETKSWVEERIRARARAREEKDWALADAIREELAQAGIVLEDGPSGTRWKRSGSGAAQPG
jgi:cysteinyl-tRNA synthetase